MSQARGPHDHGDLLFPCLFIHMVCKCATAGPEQAVHWLAEHEHDVGRDPASSTPVAGSGPVPNIQLQGAGVAGILRREAQLAAKNDE